VPNEVAKRGRDTTFIITPSHFRPSPTSDYLIQPINDTQTKMAESQDSQKKHKRQDEEVRLWENEVTTLEILPRDEWKTDSNYRLICKIAGCGTRGRSDKDDMCKKHYTIFTKVGVSTGGREKKRGKPAKKKKTVSVAV
jgi:hypothetical protein